MIVKLLWYRPQGVFIHRMTHIGKSVEKLDPAVGERDDVDAHVLDQLQVLLVVRLEVCPHQLPLHHLRLGRTLVLNNVGERRPLAKNVFV